MPQLLNKKNILVVDDYKLNHSIVKKIMSEYKNVHVAFVQDSREVINHLENEKTVNYDLIILDWEMPYIDGPSLCQVIKQHESFKKIPIIFCTANPSSSTIAKAFEVGADDYINKPICPPEFLARLERIFKNQQLTELLQRRFEEKTEVTRILSHDLNNYIAVISGTASILEKKNINKDSSIEKSVERLHRTCQRMQELIKNVREYQAIEDKKLGGKLELVNVIEIVQEALGNFEDKIIAKELVIEMNNESVNLYQDTKILAERVSLLNSVLGNVISNAIKFSNRGSKLSISLNDEGDYFGISVKDYGIGMTPDLISKVFDKFASTSRKGTEDEPGTGFGMPIVKSFMEYYGGNIQVTSVTEDQSPEDHGTEVTLEFKKVA